MDASISATHNRAGALLAALALLVLVLTACGSSSSTSSARTSESTVYLRLVAGYVDYARCARSHGMPNLPDPQVDDQGNDHYPSLDRLGHWSWPAGVIQGCAAVWARVHAIRDQFDSLHGQGRPPSIASRARAVAMARCIRRHGFPTFPDPNPDGGISPGAVPPGFTKPNLSPAAVAAINACSRPHSR